MAGELVLPPHVKSVREERCSLPGHHDSYSAAAVMADGTEQGLYWNERSRCYYNHLGTVVRIK
jgi:hypothetical protein